MEAEGGGLVVVVRRGWVKKKSNLKTQPKSIYYYQLYS